MRDRATVLWHGLVAGLVGYAAVALAFVVADLARGRGLFHTAALLGAALFEGLEDPARLVVRVELVVAYNGVHLLVFLALGLLAAWFASLSARTPHLWYLSLSLFLFVLFHLFGVLLTFTDSVRAAISSWAVLGATLVAVVAMIAYLLRVYPALRRELAGREYPE